MQENDKPSVRVHFEDFSPGFAALIQRILERRYAVARDPENPEFLFTSCLARGHSHYSCTKIYYTSENLTPDFNLFDYGIGFDHLTFGDRYLRHPYFRFYIREKDLVPPPPGFFRAEAGRKTRFCNYLYSNLFSSNPVRQEFFRLLSKYKRVDSGGKDLNNIGHCVGDKDAWQRLYKFTIAFENSSKRGYTTEKIYEALRAHTIPIYWGNPCIAADFNPGRFINCADYPSLEAVAQKVRELDNDPAAYSDMLSEPWFAGEPPRPPERSPELEAFLFHIMDQGPGRSRRITTEGFTAEYLNHIGPRTCRFIARKIGRKFICSLHKRRTESGILWASVKRRLRYARKPR